MDSLFLRLDVDKHKNIRGMGSRLLPSKKIPSSLASPARKPGYLKSLFVTKRPQPRRRQTTQPSSGVYPPIPTDVPENTKSGKWVFKEDKTRYPQLTNSPHNTNWSKGTTFKNRFTMDADAFKQPRAIMPAPPKQSKKKGGKSNGAAKNPIYTGGTFYQRMKTKSS